MSIIIAIDGPAAAGKGTLARGLANTLGLALLDTGLLYRRVARLALDDGIDLDDHAACTRLAYSLEWGTTSFQLLRSEEVAQAASRIAAIPGVRRALLDYQRQFAATPPDGTAGAVLDGRDIGTVVCPEADLKLYLVADPAIRAARRFSDNRASGEKVEHSAVLASIVERDTREATRSTAPMHPADDAIIIDTSYLTAAEVLEQALGALATRLPLPPPQFTLGL